MHSARFPHARKNIAQSAPNACSQATGLGPNTQKTSLLQGLAVMPVAFHKACT